MVHGIILFDLDGTLVDTSGDIIHTANRLRIAEGLAPLADEAVLAAVGDGAPLLLQRLFDLDPHDDERRERLLDAFRHFYLAHQTERSHPYPGIEEALVELRREHHLYVLSNKPHPAVVPELEGHDLAHYFNEIWGAGALPENKPDPIGIHTATELSGVPVSRAVMVGDMLPDVQTGANAGAQTVFCSWGFGSLGPEDPEPTVTIDKVSELVPTITQLLLA